MVLFFIGILLLITGGIFSLFFKEEIKLKVISIFSCIASLLIIASINSFRITSVELEPFGQIVFEADGLSKFFIIIISVITAMASIYANGYMKPYINKGKQISSHCLFFPLLTAAMLMVVTIQNAFAFLIVWELMSLASFFLVIFENEKRDVLKAGIKYLVYMHISVIFIIAAFVLMSIYAGSYDFADFHKMFFEYPYLKDTVFLLAFIGFGTKAGFLPMHNWLPDAHPAAPSHVSAVMSAVMIKTGIYGILRVLQIINQPTLLIGYIVLFISVITAIYGIIYAINQKDIKKLLAYSSIENIGLIGIAISIVIFGMIYNENFVTLIGTTACFMHILNHSVFKSLLFMCAGSIYLKTHTKNIEQLGGLIKKMPYTGIFLLVAAIAICAFPPLNGFISEFLIYAGLMYMLQIKSSTLFIPVVLTIASLALVGTLVILTMSKLYSISFLGNPRSEKSENVSSDVPISMLIPKGILACLTLIIGISAPLISIIIPITSFSYINSGLTFGYMQIIMMLTFVSIITILFFLFVFCLVMIKNFLTKNTAKYITWGCGYDKGNNHIQYTASSYVSPFTSILTPLFKKIFDVKKPKGLFPKDAHYMSQVEDVEEAYIINPILKFDEKFLSKFERLQDGNIQHYILYGLIFLILILAGVVFIG